MGRRPFVLKINTVETQGQLEDICNACRSHGRFAFDTEFVMEDRFEPEVCLIQLAVEDTTTIIDPFLSLDLRPVWELVGDAAVETVVHAGQEDLAFCVQHFGIPPRRVYDVQIAAGLGGYDYPLSLQKLVQQTLHIRLHKSKTLTDWRKRPLTEAQFHYGAEDVCHLLAVREKLQDRLSRRGRIDWAREEFKRFEDMSLYRRAEAEKLARVKGAGALKGQALAVVRELLAWREGLAKRRNRPARIVLKDHLLVEIAKLGLATHLEVRDLRGLNLGDRDVRELCRVVERALKIPSDEWPTPRPRETEPPREAVLIALSTAVIRSYCLENDIAYGLTASKRSIKELVSHVTKQRPADRNDVELLTGWRGRTAGALLEGVLSGKHAVGLVNDRAGVVLRVFSTTEKSGS